MAKKYLALGLLVASNLVSAESVTWSDDMSLLSLDVGEKTKHISFVGSTNLNPANCVAGPYTVRDSAANVPFSLALLQTARVENIKIKVAVSKEQCDPIDGTPKVLRLSLR